ncbi:hypothetical protein N7497_007712 [Penicillium chrysogenum]|nr:hypothetical protein N7497_007712 [Penicillium chrysogenum]
MLFSMNESIEQAMSDDTDLHEYINLIAVRYEVHLRRRRRSRRWHRPGRGSCSPSETLPKWCGHIGQGCKRTTDASLDVKRSADALAEAMAGGLPFVLQKWCGHIGQGCYKAKRAADAVDEVKRTSDALARAFAALEEEDDE